MSSIPLGPPIMPSEPSPPRMAAPALSSPSEKSEVDLINDRISGLLAKRAEFLGKASEGVREYGRLEIAKAPRAQLVIAGDGLKKIDKELRSTDEALSGEFKRLDEVFARHVRGDLGEAAGKAEERPVGGERERKAVADELPKAVKSAFEWEHSLRDQLEEELMRKKMRESGALKGKSEAEAQIAVKEHLNLVREVEPDGLDSLFRVVLEQVKKNAVADPQLQRLGELYLKSALPLQQRAKVVLGELNPAARGAAGVGTAAAAGFAEIARSQIVQPLGTSGQQVILGTGAVFKKGHVRATEEERRCAHVSRLLTGQEIVLPSFPMATATPARVGASMMSQQERLRGFPLPTDALFLAELRGKLTPENAEELEDYLKAPGLKETASRPIITAEQRLAFDKCEGRRWRYTTDKGMMRDMDTRTGDLREGDPRTDAERIAARKGVIKEIGFDELRAICLKEGMDVLKNMKLIAPPTAPGGPREEEVTEEDLLLALEVNYDFQREVPKRAEGVHFVPILEGDKKLAFEKCEEFSWIRIPSEGEKMITFRQLLKLVLEEGLYVLADYTAVPNPEVPGEEPSPPPTKEELATAVDVPWRAVFPSVIVSEVDLKGKAVTTPGVLKAFDTKARVVDMLNMFDLQTTNPELLDYILGRLSHRAEQQAIFTLTMQGLDLHAGNLAFRPVSTPQYEAVKNDPRYNKDFGVILKRYLAGELTDTDPFITLADGTMQTLRDHPELLSALEGADAGEFELVLFDTDLSLDESNRLQRMDGQVGYVFRSWHMIPLRSALLEVRAIRDKRFTKEALDLVKKEDANEANLRAWIRGDDRPIQRQLKRDPAYRQEVQKYIQPLIDAQAFARYRLMDADNTSIQLLADSFANVLSDTTEHLDFWEKFEKVVGYKKPIAGENLKQFAARNHIDLPKLVRLNPKLKDIEKVIPPGIDVRIENLTSDTLEAQHNRMQIALQLFPRMSSRQEKALFDRKEAQRDYLNSHAQLKAFFDDPAKIDLEENRAILKRYLENPHTPLPSIDKERFLKDIAVQGIEALRKFGSHLAGITSPTYLNMAQAMYPLLADSYALNKELFGEGDAGRLIGHYSHPLEHQLTAANTPRAIALALKLESTIKAAEADVNDPPSFFMST